MSYFIKVVVLQICRTCFAKSKGESCVLEKLLGHDFDNVAPNVNGKSVELSVQVLAQQKHVDVYF